MTRVVVTGGSSGIGKATADYFEEMGCTVFELSRSGVSRGNITHIFCDVTDEESVSNAAQTVGIVDVLVNNAGFGISGAIEYTCTESAKSQFEVNFFGMARVTKAFLPAIKQSKGVIINVSSVAGVLPIPFQAYYSASKAAINSYTAALANELRPYGVRVTALMPGDISTGFTDNRIKIDAEEESVQKRLAKSVGQMEKDEREGMQPTFIAKEIFRLSQKKSLKPLCTAGNKYKLFVCLNKVLPCRLVNNILSKMYAE